MSHETLTLRVTLAQAARVLADEGRDLSERVAQAHALLVALKTTAALSSEQRAALDADPGV